MNQEIANTYNQIVDNLSKLIDQSFRKELSNIYSIEALDPRWKLARKNIEGYINHIIQKNEGLKKHISFDGYFTYEDVAALLLELLWQYFHSQLEIEKTILFYKHYKIQISDKNLLTWSTN